VTRRRRLMRMQIIAMGGRMTGSASSIPEAVFIDAPRDADLRALYEYWDTVRGDRPMPRRADIDPSEIPNLLPYIIMYNAVSGGGYTVRLVGEQVVSLNGINGTGRQAGSIMTPRGAEMMTKILDAVTTEQVPKFRAGKAYWHPDKTYRDFEACFLPLSPDGETVDIILGGVKSPL
jgi:hypothetical protein